MVKPVLEYPITGYKGWLKDMTPASKRWFALFVAFLVGCATTDLKGLMDDYVATTKEEASKGYQSAELRLGKAYYFGFMPLKAPNGIVHYYPIEKNDALAYENLSKAANSGNVEAASLAGILCMNGDGTPQDDARAMAFFEQSLAYSNESRFFLSRYYWNSKDLETRKKGYDLVRYAASTDSPELVYALANYYESGIGVKRDKGEAARLRKLGAKLVQDRDELVAKRLAAFKDNSQRKTIYGSAAQQDSDALRGLQIFVTVVGVAATVAMMSSAISARQSGYRGGGPNDSWMYARPTGMQQYQVFSGNGNFLGSGQVFMY